MAKNNKQSSLRKRKINPKLAAMFKMTRDELALRKLTGGGVHRSHPKHIPRSEQNRQAINDQLK